MLTLKEVQELYGLPTINQVRYAIQQGKIKADKLGWQVVIKKKNLPETWPVVSKDGTTYRRGSLGTKSSI